jgi:hypothetical protein
MDRTQSGAGRTAKHVDFQLRMNADFTVSLSNGCADWELLLCQPTNKETKSAKIRVHP